MSHTQTYLAETAAIAGKLNPDDIEILVDHIVMMRGKAGRLFVVGLGGSAAMASHAAADFRKLCGINAVCLADNAAELTARANDEGWKTIFDGALHAYKPVPADALLVFSVGGGTEAVSVPLVAVMEYANKLGGIGVGLEKRSLDTVKEFYEAGKGYSL